MLHKLLVVHMKLTVIIGALVIALFAVLALGNFFGDKKPEREVVLTQAPQPVQGQIAQRNILVARKDIQIGTQMTPALYDIKPIAQQLIPPGAVVADDPNQVKIDGMVTNASIVANQPILTSMLRNPNDPSYIAGQLGEGMRAVTIPVGLTESLGGLVNPGDKVDVLYSHNVSTYNVDTASLKSVKTDSDEAGKTANVNISEVLIPNLKIIAVDKRLTAGTNADQQQQIPQSVTLEVNLRDAQKLQLAAKMGKLSLALRSVKDKDKFDIVRPTAEQDLSRTMPPAYFANLYDSDATYDFSVIDPYSSGSPELGAGPRGKIKLYRGSQLQEVEVKK